jgi:chorismate mutase
VRTSAVSRAVRGAVGVERNEKEAIHGAAVELIQTLLQRNGIPEDRIVSILLSMTKDLTKANPAASIRSIGFSETPLFCVQEADIEGAMPRVIRVLVTYRSEDGKPPIPVYLGRARALRLDLTEEDGGAGR